MPPGQFAAWSGVYVGKFAVRCLHRDVAVDVIERARDVNAGCVVRTRKDPIGSAGNKPVPFGQRNDDRGKEKLTAFLRPFSVAVRYPRVDTDE